MFGPENAPLSQGEKDVAEAENLNPEDLQEMADGADDNVIEMKKSDGDPEELDLKKEIDRRGENDLQRAA